MQLADGSMQAAEARLQPRSPRSEKITKQKPQARANQSEKRDKKQQGSGGTFADLFSTAKQLRK